MTLVEIKIVQRGPQRDKAFQKANIATDRRELKHVEVGKRPVKRPDLVHIGFHLMRLRRSSAYHGLVTPLRSDRNTNSRSACIGIDDSSILAISSASSPPAASSA
eukprot:CAMPEP_0113530110 /NCGR_PEP_ID=MMETSP0015_2-20120614/2757_1 /TAXON_ID=2838 /ORGANISM="Odontella" /LENGTH=104 /DNA_ID=CAMNT_0000428795 /DNA_START=1428 /DNA_END=1742 /DNA_ORIENTATION=+ /assembly_acc=CAM_ASM_000160